MSRWMNWQRLGEQRGHWLGLTIETQGNTEAIRLGRGGGNELASGLANEQVEELAKTG